VFRDVQKMKVKFISSVLFSMFLFAVMNLLFGLVHNANAQQQRISFQGKYGVQLPYKLVEETSIPPNARLVKLSRRRNVRDAKVYTLREY